jgi:uncharacterized membrane protein YdjX (TVP38/TMEM64 family)
MPGSNLVCLLAGARGMSARTFGLTLSTGILVRLAFFWFVGKAFQDPLQTLLDWITKYQWWIAGAFLILTMAQSFRRASVAVKQLPQPDATSADEEQAG